MRIFHHCQGLSELTTNFLSTPGSGSLDLSSLNLNHSLDVSRTSVFLDGGIVLPTAAGVPLSLAVNGTYAASIDSNLKMDTDLVTFLSTGKADLRASVYPAATIEVTKNALNQPFSQHKLSFEVLN